ncbi:hypothetical protein I3760_16G031600 [Carya illinoinensis]|nr:hypothetical protein I3760_16G031600 [Carya illinoinensis]
MLINSNDLEEQFCGLPWPPLDEETLFIIPMKFDLSYFFEDFGDTNSTKKKRQNPTQHGVGKQMKRLKEVLKPDQTCWTEFKPKETGQTISEPNLKEEKLKGIRIET